MNPAVFERLREIIHQESGISLGDEKLMLLSNRLRKRMRVLGLSEEVQYLRIIETEASGAELVELIDLISTNHTFFYRENDHFEHLRKLFTQWKLEHRPTIKGWSAASSSGEEPYTIALTALECLNLKSSTFRFLATDICTKVLQKASNGIYEPNQVKDVPPALLQRYFERKASPEGNIFKVSPELRQLVLYKRFNLARFPYQLKGEFDFIFCRNVMIYFEDELRERILGEFYRLLKPGGTLFVGHSESLTNLDHGFRSVGGAVYLKE